MSQQIKFFEKNVIDLENEDVTITVTDAVATNNGQDFIDFIRNRSNLSAWITTGSTDAASTTLEVDWITGRDVTDIILIKHNWKAYTIQYWNGLTWTDFSTPISVSGSTDETTQHEFDSVEISRIRIIITETQVTDDDKELYQLVVTNKIASGQLTGWPLIRKPTFDNNKIRSKMLSGKFRVAESVGAWGFDLEVRNWSIQADLDIVENIFFRREGFLVWLSGNDEEQFRMEIMGYRKEDLFLMRLINDYRPEWVDGIYSNGLRIKMSLRESID